MQELHKLGRTIGFQLAAGMPRRNARILSKVRTNPELALRVACALTPSNREVFISELSKPERVVPVAAVRPALAKCIRSPYAAESGLTAQLALFAHSVGRVR